MATATFHIRNLTNRNGGGAIGNWFKSALIYGNISGTALTNITISSIRLRSSGIRSTYSGYLKLVHNGTTLRGRMTPQGWDSPVSMNISMTGYKDTMFSVASGKVSIEFERDNEEGSFMFTVDDLALEVTYNYNVSTLTIDKESLQAGESFTATIGSHSVNYTHKLVVSMGEKTETIELAAGVTSHEYKVDEEWLSTIPTSFSGPMAVVLETYSGTKKMGAETKSIQVNCPDYNLELSNFSVERLLTVNEVSFPDYGVYVQNKSAVKIHAKTPALYGAYISQLRVSISGYSGAAYNMLLSNEEELTLLSGLLNKTGSVKISLNARDSRGKTVDDERTITVLPYSTPRITQFSGYRSNGSGDFDVSGTNGATTFRAEFTPVNGDNGSSNTLEYAIEWRERGSSVWRTEIQGSANSATVEYEGILPSASFDILKQYEIRATVYDGYTKGDPVSEVVFVNSMSYPVHFSADGHSVAFGQACSRGTEPSFEVSPEKTIYIYGQDIRNLFCSAEDMAKTEAKLEMINELKKALLAKNELDNGYFVNPINQRGDELYDEEAYSIDRWKLIGEGSSVSIRTGGIFVTGELVQYVPDTEDGIYTGAVCDSNGNISVVSGNVENGEFSNEVISCSKRSTGGIVFSIKASGTYKWAALYKGEYTVDNLPVFIPKSRAQELLECQRYYIRLNVFKQAVYCLNTGARAAMTLPTVLRLENPTLIVEAVGDIVQDGSHYAITSTSLMSKDGNRFYIGLDYAQQSGMNGKTGMWDNGIIALDADL